MFRRPLAVSEVPAGDCPITCYGEFTNVTDSMIEDTCLMRFEKQLRYLDQTRRYSIAATSAGWEVREERGAEVVRHQHLRDWHRVERVRQSIVLEMDALREEGWRDVTETWPAPPRAQSTSTNR